VAAFGFQASNAIVDWPQSARTLDQIDSEAAMRRKALVYCEVCGGTTPAGAPDYLIFHCLAFCSPDCLDEYKAAGEGREANKQTPATDRTSAPRRPRAA
jgi:hypothetical protein